MCFEVDFQRLFYSFITLVVQGSPHSSEGVRSSDVFSSPHQSEARPMSPMVGVLILSLSKGSFHP